MDKVGGRETFPIPHTGNGNKNSKWRPPSLSYTVEIQDTHYQR
jgi:hypothetical protein